MQSPCQSWRRAHASRPTNTCGRRAPLLPPGPASVCRSPWAPVDSALGPAPSLQSGQQTAPGWAQGPDLTARESLTLQGAARPPDGISRAGSSCITGHKRPLQVQMAPPAQEAFNSQPPPQGTLCCPRGGKPHGPAPGQFGGSKMSFKPPSVTSGFNFLYEICTFPPRAFITWYIVKTLTATSEDSGRSAINSGVRIRPTALCSPSPHRPGKMETNFLLQPLNCGTL